MERRYEKKGSEFYNTMNLYRFITVNRAKKKFLDVEGSDARPKNDTFLSVFYPE